MAVVLEGYFAGRISAEHLVLWLYSDGNVVETETDILKDKSLRAEFLPFFINYLRDQTSHLVHGSSSTGLSPAKTPASAQKFRRSSLQRQNSTDEHRTRKQDSSNRNVQRRLNRTQLFSPSPLKSDVSDETLTRGSVCGKTESPCSLPEAEAWSQDGQFYLKTPLNENKTRSRRVSPSFNKKDEQLTLGQYIKSDGFSLNHPKGRRRSDQYHKDNTSHKTPANNKRRSGGKGNKTSYSDSSLKYKTEFVFQDCKTPEFALDDSEEFPVVGAPSLSVNTPTRRITPTAVTGQRKALVTRVKRQPLIAPVFSKSYQEEPHLNHLNPHEAADQQTSSSSRGLEMERELLRLERLKQQASQDSASINPVSDIQSPVKTPVKSSQSSAMLSCQSEFTTPCRNQVTYPEYVDKLADLYSGCIKECLMPNLTLELYFIVHLLTAKGSAPSIDNTNEHCDPEDVNYLCSIHNCVQFAVYVLHEQFWLLTFLDRTTLKLLADLPHLSDTLVISPSMSNRLLTFLDRTTLKLLADLPHLSDFSPGLKSQLESAIDCNTAQRSIIQTAKSPVQAVPFLADTDNRTNFPSEGAFHSFKKQRDKFYELLRYWLDHHQVPGWSMEAAMSKRIRDLVQSVVDAANCAHFARLFSSQLTRMCQGERLISDHRDDGRERGFLGDLKKTNPEKFKRLEERFSIPTTSAGPSPPPAFHGCQEFFKEFIVAADSYLFTQHLINNFSSNILELNDMQFGLSDQDGDSESSGVDDEVRISFSSSLQSARLLAKYLGFLVFLPYQGSDALPESVQNDVIAFRNKSPMDILGVLGLSYRHQRLVFTVPWIVEYLSMMDPIAARLESFQVVLRLLIQIYRDVSRMLSMDQTSYNMLLILLVLGWLFEVPGMPASMYFMSFTDDFIVDTVTNHEAPFSTALDSHRLVDQQLLYLCCPYLVDVRVLLSDASLGCGSKATPMKKITPISAKTPPTSIQTAHQLQQDLEKNFFDNHSPSLKKTVDFISSRLSSNCIKHIDATLVSAARSAAVRLLECEVRSEEVGTIDKEWSTEMRRALLRRIKARGEEIAIATREAAEKKANEFVSSRSQAALSVLLPIETSEQVLKAAAYITSRLAMERATRWIDTQIQAAIQQELSNSIDKAIRSAKKDADSKLKLYPPDIHDQNVPAPSVLIQQYKDILRYILTGSVIHCVTVEEIAKLLREMRQVLHFRQDLTPLAYQMLQQLSIDLASALVVFKPLYLHSTCTDYHGTNTGLSLKQTTESMTNRGSDRHRTEQVNLRLDMIEINGKDTHPRISHLSDESYKDNRMDIGDRLDVKNSCRGQSRIIDDSCNSSTNGAVNVDVVNACCGRGDINGSHSGIRNRTGVCNKDVEDTCCKQSQIHNGRNSELPGLGNQLLVEDELRCDYSSSHFARTDVNQNSRGFTKVTRKDSKDSTLSCGTKAVNPILPQNGWQHGNSSEFTIDAVSGNKLTARTEITERDSSLTHIDQANQRHQVSTATTHTNCNGIPGLKQTAKDLKQTADLRQSQEKNQCLEDVPFATRTTLNVPDPTVAECPQGNSRIPSTVLHQPTRPNLCLDRQSSVSLTILDVFINLWKDHFKCQVPPEPFLCPKNAVLIEKLTTPKDSWNATSHLITTLVANDMTRSTEVKVCLSDLVQSNNVDVAETAADASWVISQRVTQRDGTSNTSD